jgi:magnesium-protoporphyrin O-methyltransferase
VKRGLERSEQSIATKLGEMGLSNQALLEIGGGVGDLQIALLESGVAATAINVDLAPTWEEAAHSLLADRHLTGRVSRRQGNFVEIADDIPTVDVVVLHRVVCCYPDWRSLLRAAADKAGRLLVMTFPPAWTKPLLMVENVIHRLRRRQFRAFVHSPAEMVQMLGSAGLKMTQQENTFLWSTAYLSRA